MHFLRVFAGIVYYLLVLITLVLIGSFIFFSTGCRDISLFNPLFSRWVERHAENLAINITKSYLTLDLEKGTFVLTSEDIDFFWGDQKFVMLDNINFNITPLNFFKDRKKVVSLDFGTPEFDFPSVYNVNNNENNITPVAELRAVMLNNIDILREFKINIDDVLLSANILDTPLPFYISNLNIQLLESEDLGLQASLIYNIDESYGKIDLTVGFDGESLSINGAGHDIETDFISKLWNKHYDVGGLLTKLNLQFNGRVNENLELSFLTAEGITNGYFSNSEFIDGDLPISEGRYKVTWGNNFNELLLEDLEIFTPKFTAKGSAKYAKNNFESDLKISNFDLLETFELLPHKHIRELKQWLQENIISADAGEITLNAQFKIRNDRIYKNGENPFVKAVLPIKKAKVKFMDNAPLFQGANANLYITETGFTGKISEGRLDDLMIKDITITDFYDKNDLRIYFDLSTPLEEQLKAVNKIYNIDFIPQEIMGDNNLKTSIDIIIPLEDQNTEANTLYKAKVSFDDHKVVLPKFKQHLLLKDMDLSLRRDQINMDINSSLHNTAVKILYNYNLKNKKKDINFNSQLTYFDLQNIVDKNLSVKLPDYAQGDISINGDTNGESLKMNIDLTKSIIKIPALFYSKRVDNNANIELSFTPKEDSFIFDLPYFKGQGSFKLRNNTLVELKARNVELYQGDFDVNYTILDNKENLELKGKTLDLQNVKFLDIFGLISPQNEKEQSKKNNIKSKNYNIDFEKIKLPNDTSLNNTTLNMHCAEEGCINAKFNALINNNHFISLEMDKEKINIFTDETSYIAKILGNDEVIAEGVLKIKGLYNEDNSMDGELLIEGIYLKNIPGILKLLSVAGIHKAVGNNEEDAAKGTLFQSLKCSLRHENGKLSLNDCLAVSPMLRIKGDGYIDFNDNHLKFKGLLINEDILSDIIRQIPIIGYTLGKNDSLIATKFKIQGDFDDIQVSVNPLSTLAPGFLKEIFE